MSRGKRILVAFEVYPEGVIFESSKRRLECARDKKQKRRAHFFIEFLHYLQILTNKKSSQYFDLPPKTKASVVCLLKNWCTSSCHPLIHLLITKPKQIFYFFLLSNLLNIYYNRWQRVQPKAVLILARSERSDKFLVWLSKILSWKPEFEV